MLLLGTAVSVALWQPHPAPLEGLMQQGNCHKESKPEINLTFPASHTVPWKTDSCLLTG